MDCNGHDRLSRISTLDARKKIARAAQSVVEVAIRPHWPVIECLQLDQTLWAVIAAGAIYL